MSRVAANSPVVEDDPDQRIHIVLDGSTVPISVLLDGRAVRIIRDGVADWLTPVRRVDRITCRGDVQWSTRALLALADAGAPIGLVRRDGTLAAVVTGRMERRWGSLAEALARVARRPDFWTRVEDWRRGSVSRHARAIGIADPAGAARLGWAAAEEAMVQTSRVKPTAVARRLARLAHTFAELLARRVLSDAGCPAKWLGTDGPAGGDLAVPFGQIALWRLVSLAASGRGAEALRRDMANDAATVSGEPIPGREPLTGRALHATGERAAPLLRRALARDIRHFHTFLVELDVERRFGDRARDG